MIGILIQARYNSARLPGKVLMDIAGKPLLLRITEVLTHNCPNVPFVIATSNLDTDLPIKEFCNNEKISCFQGSLDNVALRMQDAALDQGWDAFVRICGDSPLVCSDLISGALDLFKSGNWDVVTNTLNRSYPKGLSVEVVKTSALQEVLNQPLQDLEVEHFTQNFYRYTKRFNIYNFSQYEDMSTLQLSVDEEEDLRKMRSIFEAMDRPHWEYSLREVMALYSEVFVS